MNGQHFHMIFSPQNSSLEVLDATLTSDRRTVTNLLLESVRKGLKKKSSHHHLLLGPRGSGKTHVLSFVLKTIKKKPTEFPDVLILALSEEERGLTSLLDFVLACLRSAKIDSTALAREMAGRPRAEVEQEVIRRLEQVANKSTVIVFVENLSSLFAALENNELDRLRGFLQTHPQLSLMASSTELFSDSTRADHPFYGFFDIQPLRSLKRKETGCYLANLAKSRGDHSLAAELRKPAAKPRLNAIYDLTGGNHRLLAMLGNFLTVEGLADLVAPFVQTVDRELTPYYQQRLDRLSPQQNKILRTIADQHGRALPVKEIASLIFSDSQTVSRQLHDLLHCGLVQRTPRGRESCYELHEPLMRLVLDIKEGRNRPLPLIVSFLTKWHGIAELKELAEKAPVEVASYYRQAHANAEWQFAKALFGKGMKQRALGHPEEELATYDDIIKRFGTSDQPKLQAAVAAALVSKGDTLGTLGRFNEGLAAYDDMLKCYGNRDQTLVAMALINKGSALVELGRKEEGLAVCEDVIRRFEKTNHEAVARALVNKSLILESLERGEEALTVYDEVIHRFGTSNQPELQKQSVTALIKKGVLLGTLGRATEGLAVCDDVIKRFEINYPDAVAMALLNKSIILESIGRAEEELATYDEVIHRFETSNTLELQNLVARALVNKSVTLGILDRANEGLAVCDDVIKRFEKSNPEAVARVLVNKSILLQSLGRADEGIAACEDVVARFGTSNQEAVARALIIKGAILRALGRIEEGIKTYDSVVARFGASKQPELQRQTAEALLEKGVWQLLAGETEAALSTCDSATALQLDNAGIYRLKILTLLKLTRIDQAFSLIESLASRFPLEDDFWPRVVAQMIPFIVHDTLSLGRLRDIFGKHLQILIPGLIAWIRSLIPLIADKARQLEETEVNLRQTWGSIPDCDLPLKMLNVLRRDAQGDDKALLELPLEIRNLIHPSTDEDKKG